MTVIDLEARRAEDHRRRSAQYLEQAACLVRSAARLQPIDGEQIVRLELSLAEQYLAKALEGLAK